MDTQDYENYLIHTIIGKMHEDVEFQVIDVITRNKVVDNVYKWLLKFFEKYKPTRNLLAQSSVRQKRANFIFK
jgi:hypothetical protein